MILMLEETQKLLTNMYKGTWLLPSYLIYKLEKSVFKSRAEAISAIDESLLIDNPDQIDILPTKKIDEVLVFDFPGGFKLKLTYAAKH